MKRTLAITILATAWCSVDAQTERIQFVGVWELVSVEIRNDSGEWSKITAPDGSDLFGILIYTSTGHVAVQMTAGGRPLLPDESDLNAATPGQLRAAISGYLAYFGTFEVNQDGSLTHHQRGHIVPNNMGASEIRPYRLHGDLLTLAVPEGGSRLVWRRISQR